MWLRTIAVSILILHVKLILCQKYQDLQLLFVNGFIASPFDDIQFSFLFNFQ